MNKSILLLPLLVAGLAKSQEGRVGINTVSPKTTLDVNGKSDSNGLSLSGDITGLQAPRLTRAELTNKGNTLYGADQRGAIVYITDVSGGNNVSQRVNITSVGYYYFDGTVWNRIASNSGALLNSVTSDNGLTKTGDNIQLGGTLIKNTDIATAGFNTTFSGTGKVGIGTNIPSNLLTINKSGITSGIATSFVDGITITSNMDSTGFSGPGLYFEGANGSAGQKVLKVNYSKNISDQSFLNFQAVTDDASTTSNMVMSIFHNGKIGVGNTDPTQQFDVNGNVRFRQVPENASIDTNDRVMVLDNTGVAKKVPLSSVQSTFTSDNGLTKTGNNVQLGGTLLKNTDIATAGFNTTFSGAGNLGLGVVPTKKLDVDGDTYLRGRLNLAATYDDGATLIVKNKTAGNWIASFASAGTGPYRAVLLDNGNFGVGAIDPSENLDVNGNVRFRSVPSSSTLASGESIMVLQADGTAKKVPLSVLQQSLSKIYYRYYIFVKDGSDFVSNFDTKIPTDKYTVVVAGFDTNLTGIGGGFVKNSPLFDFQIANILAVEENNTWRIKVDVPNATISGASMAWGVRVLIISNEQLTNLSTGSFNLGTSNTGSDTASPVP